jgi:Subtilase family/Repeat of unknown function (DUF346)
MSKKLPTGPRAGRKKSTVGATVSEGNRSERELIVMTKQETGCRVSSAPGERVTSTTGVDVAPLAKLLKTEDINLEPLFGLSEDRMLDQTTALKEETGTEVPDLSIFYQVSAPDDRLDDLAKSLGKLDVVEAAYVKPPGEPPEATEPAEVINDMKPRTEDPPVATPDFTSRQGYLNTAPAGIDARFAWGYPGGKGANVKIIDCEWGWRFTHEDLRNNQMGVVVGTTSTNDNHGTAVLGEISGDPNSMGITGICPDATVGAARFGNTAQTIRQAADRLRRGDIILLEIHRAGPRHNFQGRQDQKGYIAIEWWPDDFAAIRYAVSKGIIVVEAAGNGGENFDDAIYNTRPTGFPTSWRNPFRTNNPSSEAVLVGAGAPPPGTHGRDHGPDRSRLGFSNFGARLDCQGWGREVTTTGYGDLQGGSGIHRNEWYTDTFSGTSSASPIVVGALGCIQGILRARGASLLTSAQAIHHLRTTGTPQQSAPTRPASQRIGNRPNLRELIPAVVPTNRWRGWEDLGGVIIGAPAVSSWSANRLDTFVRGTNNRMYHKWWNGSRWSHWENLGGVIVAAPAAVSWGRNRIDTFAPGTNNHMYHKWWNGSRWRGWEDLGGVIIGAPAVASWSVNRLDTFVRGTNNRMYHKWWNGSSWSGWENLGGALASAPAAVSWGPNRIDCFVAGTNNHMYHKWWNGSRWRGWEDLGGQIIGAPTVASWAPNRLDTFVRGTNNRMYHKWWNGTRWSHWENLGGVIVDSPTATSWGRNRIDCFAPGTNNHMYHKWFG